MSDDIYQRLRKGVAKHSAYFQATAAGLEIEFLRKLFTEEEAEIYLNLTGNLETAHQIAERAAQDPAVVAATLKRMAGKGLVFPKRKSDSCYYAAPPFAHGILEHQVHRIDKELAQIYEDYIWAEKLPEDSNDEQPVELSLPLRSLPVKVPINISRPVAPYEDVKELIKKQDALGAFGIVQDVTDIVTRPAKEAAHDCGKVEGKKREREFARDPSCSKGFADAGIPNE